MMAIMARRSQTAETIAGQRRRNVTQTMYPGRADSTRINVAATAS